MAETRPTRPSQLIPASPRSDRAAREVLEAAGGRDALEEALELSGADPLGSSSRDILLSYLRDPEISRVGDKNAPTLTELAKRAGVNRLELYDMLGKRDIAMAVFMSRRKHLADLLDDIGEDARSQIVPCRNCRDGVVPPSQEDVRAAEQEAERLRAMGIEVDSDSARPQPTVCADCNGVGSLRKIGDAHARNVFFRVHGFDKGGAAQPVLQNLNVGVQVVNNTDKSGKAEPVTVKVQKILDGG